MRKVSVAGDNSREARIVRLEYGLAQLWSQVTALQTRVGTLEARHKTQKETHTVTLGAVGEQVAPVRATKES